MSEEKKAAEQSKPREILALTLALTDDELEVISGGISEQLRKDFFSDEQPS